MSDPEDLAGSPVAAVWEDLLADTEATAEEFESEGFETLQLHPGDATVLSGEYGDRVGIDVLIPDNEYEDLEALFEAGFTVEGYEVYRSTEMGYVFLLVVVYDGDREQAVLFPAYYPTSDPDVTNAFETIREDGAVHTYLRRLSGEFVEVRHDDPDLFAPPEGFDDGDSVDPLEASEESDDQG